MFFVDRHTAGRRLVGRLKHLRGAHLVLLGLPHAGVPVAAGVARALGAPLDVCPVGKLRVPFQPELARGAVGEGGLARLRCEHALARVPGATRPFEEPGARRQVTEPARDWFFDRMPTPAVPATPAPSAHLRRRHTV